MFILVSQIVVMYCPMVKASINKTLGLCTTLRIPNVNLCNSHV